MPPQTRHADDLHAAKYRAPGEDFREAMNRTAGALKDSDEHWEALREICLDQRFLFGGRIQASVGSARVTTAYNCFVAGTIPDSMDGIMASLRDAALTMRLGGGIGYDFSTLRPKGALIHTLGSPSSGPLGFMPMFDAMCRAISSAGERRGAQMGVLRVDHPDVEAFVHCKQDETSLTGFNISLGITDEFMRAVAKGGGFDLRWGGQVVRTIDAAALWEAVMRSAWDWGEPGVIFLDTVNRLNNLAHIETICATNPCAEQPLPPHGACLLGSFNLVKYLKEVPAVLAKYEVSTGHNIPVCVSSAEGHLWSFDYEQFERDIPVVMRAMDNVIDGATYPLPEQEAEAKSKRRMGLGVTGLANAGEAVAGPYGSSDFIDFEVKVLDILRYATYRASIDLAREKGPFPAWDGPEWDKRYGSYGFVSEMGDSILKAIQNHGIRNSHLLSIAPAGTISLCADNVSSGIEPVFSYRFERSDVPGGAVEDYGAKFLGVRGKRITECTLDDHLDVLIAAQERVDSGVSKTVSVSPSTPWDEFKGLYARAWERGAKGLATFNPGGLRAGVLSEAPSEEGDACAVDLMTGVKSCE